MITVIQVFGSLNAGGAESRMMDVFRAIDRTKFQFIYVTLDTSDNQFYEKEILSLGGKVIKLPSPRQVGIRSHIRQLEATFKELKSKGEADCVHAHTFYHSGIAMLAAYSAGIPIRIAHARTTSSVNKHGIANKFMIAVGKLLTKVFATHRLALNKETAKSLFGNCRNVRIIPNAIPLELYSNAQPSEIYSTIPDTAKIICHIGRFQSMKNQEFLLRLFAPFIKVHPESWLVLVGDGKTKLKMESLAEELGIANRTVFTGIRRDIPQILARASVFVLPSKFEGLVGSVLEAQASGVGCVVSDTVPKNVDMGLDLVEFVSLNAPASSWLKAIEHAITLPKVSFEKRYAAFDKHGFTIANEIKLLTTTYENTDNNYHNI